VTDVDPDVSTVLEPTDLLGVFIRAVSHDLRSPLLTLSLGLELLSDATSSDERARVAREALTEGVAELERMLDAVSAISRARSRILTDQPVALAALLGEHRANAAGVDPEGLRVTVDPRSVNEAIEAIDATMPVELTAAVRDRGTVELSAGLPAEFEAVERPPLEMLLGSLQEYAATPIAALAAAQVLLERQGGGLRCERGRVVLSLPLA
jgi:hypothetical protein